jgi:hypothetical protein
MSDFLGRFPFFNISDWLGWSPDWKMPATMSFLPEWMIGALAAILVLSCLFAFSRVARATRNRGLGFVGLVLIGAAIVWIVFGGSSRRDHAAERLALDARAAQLTLRAMAQGTALACLNADAGDALAASCEKALFATPEAAAAAVSFVSAQLTLLADSSQFTRRDPSYRGIITQLRHAAEADRYGIVAHVLATRESCTADQCEAFAVLNDLSRVKANLTEHPYDLYVAHYAAGWPAADPSIARSSPPPALASAPPSVSAAGIKVPGPNVFFPSAASIPPVNIMNAEPAAPTPAETTGTTPPAKAAATPQRKAPTPPRRPPNAKADPQRAPPPPVAE